MPTSSTAFTSVPSNRNARRRFMRAARLGTRPVPATPNIGDAAKAVDTVRAIAAGWTASTDPFPTTVKSTWATRTERP
jgi:hypothetical protein